MIDTPLVAQHSAVANYFEPTDEVVPVEFARKLELELNQALRKIKQLEVEIHQHNRQKSDLRNALSPFIDTHYHG